MHRFPEKRQFSPELQNCGISSPRWRFPLYCNISLLLNINSKCRQNTTTPRQDQKIFTPSPRISNVLSFPVHDRQLSRCAITAIYSIRALTKTCFWTAMFQHVCSHHEPPSYACSLDVKPTRGFAWCTHCLSRSGRPWVRLNTLRFLFDIFL